MSESPEPSSTPLPPSGDSGDSGPVPHLEWDAFPWHHFRGYTKSQRAGKLKSWIWSFGFDIEHQANVDNRLWVSSQVAEVIESFEIQDKIGQFGLG
ncbi:hypothetical protein HRG_014300 [Hirsutella rhossiliensis]